jgi:hypothetical protein
MATAPKWLQLRWETLFPALLAATAEDEIQRICEAEIAAWRARPEIKSESTLRNPMDLSRKEIKARLEGDQQTLALKHLAFSREWYIQQNAGSREKLAERHENQQFLQDPQAIVTKAEQLLASEQWPDLAVALAVTTGRRLGEVLRTGVFAYKTMYSVTFSGVLKRREIDLTPFEIPTLVGSQAVIDAVTRLREYLPIAEEEDIHDVTRKHSPIVKEAADRHFAELVPVREGRTSLYSHLMRSVYGRIAVFWFAPPKVSAMHYMATIFGHFEFEDLETEDLRQNYTSNAHYADYVIADKEGNIDGRQGLKLGQAGVELLERFKPKSRRKSMTTDTATAAETKPKGKNYPVTVDQDAYNRVVGLRTKLGHKTYAQTLNYLLDALEAAEKQQAEAEKQQQDEAKPEETDQPAVAIAEVELVPERLSDAETAAVIHEAMQVSGKDFPAFLAEALSKEAKFQISLSKRHAGLDFTTMTTSKLSKTRHPDAARERVRRAIAAIAAYNDAVQSGNDRWFINPTIIQQLVGVRFELIAEYCAEHSEEIETLNEKHELSKRHNHKVGKISEVITVPENPPEAKEVPPAAAEEVPPAEEVSPVAAEEAQ